MNPSPAEIEEATLDLIVAADKDNIVMVEGEAKEAQESEMVEALGYAHEVIKLQCQAQIELAEEVGATEKRAYSHENSDEELLAKIKEHCYDKVYEVAKQGLADKKKRGESFAADKRVFSGNTS